jgi:hypothetical protein
LNSFEQRAEVVEQTPHALINQPAQDGHGQVRLPYSATSHQQQAASVARIAFDETVGLIECAKL